MQMEICGIKSQWIKRIVLQRLLPKKVAMNVKGLLSKSKTEAGNSIYKDIKDRILQILGPKEQDMYRKATSLVMVDSPSQLARAMVNLLCKCGPNTPLNGCCGEAIIMSFLHSIMLRCRSLQSQRTQTQQQQVRGSLRGSCTL